jgi:hypothetical protein
MRKLRLIKPWGLVMRRQHLMNEHYFTFEHSIFFNCSGPVLDSSNTAPRFYLADIRSAEATTDRQLHDRIAAKAAIKSASADDEIR